MQSGDSPTASSPATFDVHAFRRALGNFATGVTVVTASAGDQKAGITANSFNSVSLDPPLILWSISRQSSSYTVFQTASHFAVNVLAEDQLALSNQFSRAPAERFINVAYRAGLGGCLLLEGTSANFQCETHQILEGGDHWILIGKVVTFEDHGRSPLLYHQGSYATVLPHPYLAPGRREKTPGPLRGKLGDHLYYLMTQAVRSYQQAYEPAQLKTGWRLGEARLLMILDADAYGKLPTLIAEADMPGHEVQQTLELLCSRGLVEQSGAGYRLTPAGARQAHGVWTLAQRQQKKIFARFTPAQLSAFKDVLKGVMEASQIEGSR